MPQSSCLEPHTAEPTQDETQKAYFSGTHRSKSPAETLALIEPMMPDFGITRVANVTGLDRIGIPVVMVVRPNSRAVAVSQGKGLDLASAKVSGLMESIECWHAERGAHPLKLSSFADFRDDHPVIDISRIPKIKGSRFNEKEPLLWVEGHNLLDDAPTWLPYEMVHSNYTLPRPTGHGCFPASTNGLASGNNIFEATSHAICEIVERDATTLLHQLPKPARDARLLNLGSVEDTHCRELLDRLEDGDLDAVVWDTTTDIGLPSFYCLLIDRGSEQAHIGAGAGCHPARDVALSRTLTEAVQTRTTYIAGSRDDLSPSEFTDKGLAQKQRYARDLIGATPARRDWDSIPQHELKSFNGELKFLLQQIEIVGINEVVSVDLSRPATGIAVARVVIPGLEAPHDDDCYIPGPRARQAACGERS